jgi:hypothetical protein
MGLKREDALAYFWWRCTRSQEGLTSVQAEIGAEAEETA